MEPRLDPLVGARRSHLSSFASIPRCWMATWLAGQERAAFVCVVNGAHASLCTCGSFANPHSARHIQQGASLIENTRAFQRAPCAERSFAHPARERAIASQVARKQRRGLFLPLQHMADGPSAAQREKGLSDEFSLKGKNNAHMCVMSVHIISSWRARACVPMCWLGVR